MISKTFIKNVFWTIIGFVILAIFLWGAANTGSSCDGWFKNWDDRVECYIKHR